MTTVSYLAVPLTPIHVGDGTTLSPEGFLIDGGALARFDAASVIAAMAPAARSRFLAALDGGRLQEAWQELRKAAAPEHRLERVALGPGSERELRDAVENPHRRGRRGEASPFVRTGGRPYLPGSSLKGAFRTAVVDALAHDAEHEDRVSRDLDRLIESLQPKQKATGCISNRVQELALDCPPGKTETDPLRWLVVGDAVVPESGTRFDQVSIGWKDGRAPKMQVHVERLWSFADAGGNCVAAFPLTLSAADERRQTAARRLDADKTPRLDLRLDAVLAAAHAFHDRRWRAEIDRFFANSRDALNGLRDRFERELRRAAGAEVPLVLLRVGRFGHFESKSVDDWRRGWQAMPKPGRHVQNGSTRAVLNGLAGFPLPFGWLMLCPDTPEVRAWAEDRKPELRAGAPVPGGATQPSERRAPAPARPARPGLPASLVGRRGTVEGETAVVIEDNGAKLWVEFPDANERDEINRNAFEPD